MTPPRRGVTQTRSINKHASQLRRKESRPLKTLPHSAPTGASLVSTMPAPSGFCEEASCERYNSAMLKTKTLKLLSDLTGRVTGVTVKPALFQLVKSHVNGAYPVYPQFQLVKSHVNGAYPVYPHPYQREDICIFYDRKTLEAHLRLAEEERGFTVTPQAGFDVTAALKERGESTTAS